MSDFRIFESSGSQYTVEQILVAAEFRGEMVDIRKEMQDSLSCREYAEEEGFVLDEETLQADSDAFRYQHRLITVEETDTWLSECNLTLDDLSDFLERDHWRKRFNSQLAWIRSEYPVHDSLASSQIWQQIILTGRFRHLAFALAKRVGLNSDSGHSPPAEMMEEERGIFLTRTHCGPDGLQAWLERNQCTREWFDQLLAMESRYRATCRSMLDPERCTRELHLHRVALTRVEGRTTAFSSAQIAEEAYLCLTNDKETLEEVAHRCRAEITFFSFFLRDLPEELKQRFFSASSGEVLGPLGNEGKFWIYQLIRKTEPSLGDPEIMRFLEERILSGFFNPLLEKYIRWVCSKSLLT